MKKRTKKNPSKSEGQSFQKLILFSFFRNRGFFDRLVQGAIGAVRDANLDHLAVDHDFSLLEIDVPAATGSTEGMATIVPADGSFSGDRAISGHTLYLFRNKRDKNVTI